MGQFILARCDRVLFLLIPRLIPIEAMLNMLSGIPSLKFWSAINMYSIKRPILSLPTMHIVCAYDSWWLWAILPSTTLNKTNKEYPSWMTNYQKLSKWRDRVFSFEMTTPEMQHM